MMHSIEAIRRRPGMYVGDIHDGSGRLQLLWELVANALDEHMAGRCDDIRVEIDAEGAFVIEDNGRGMRVDCIDGVPFAQIALTRFHDGPTLDGHAPHEHVGQRGVGLFPVCALSRSLDLAVFRDGRRYFQAYAQGRPLSELVDEGRSDRHGTRIRVLPDIEIFGDSPIETQPITTRLRELACLFPSLKMSFRDHRERHFHVPDGLVGMLAAQLQQEGLRPVERIFRCDVMAERIGVEVVLAWTAGFGSRIESFANVSRTTDGGTHVAGLLEGLVRGARQSLPFPTRGRRAREIRSSIERGLRGVVCVRLDDPAYARPTRDCLSTPEVTAAVASGVAPAFASWLGQSEKLRSAIASALSRKHVAGGD